MDRTQENLVQEINNLYDELQSWQKVGDHYGVHKTVVWRIVNEHYEPKDSEIRKKLGFREIIQQSVKRDPQGRFSK